MRNPSVEKANEAFPGEGSSGPQSPDNFVDVGRDNCSRNSWSLDSVKALDDLDDVSRIEVSALVDQFIERLLLKLPVHYNDHSGANENK
jgi:hypothetical protein